jgi:Flp pilus assembly pilin Flp
MDMLNLFKSFWAEEDGATIIEYVLMLAVAAGIVMFAFPNLRTALVGWMSDMFSNVGIGMDSDNEFTGCNVDPVTGLMPASC